MARPKNHKLLKLKNFQYVGLLEDQDAKAITEPLFQAIFNTLGPFVEEIFGNSKVAIEWKYPKQIIVTVVQTTYKLGAHP